MAKVCNMLFLGIIAVIVVSTTADYCDLESCNQSGTHTMCMFKSDSPASACVNPSSIGFSKTEKQAIVDKHNKLRQFVASGQESRGKNGPQPPAVSMPDLSWDDELATIAQRWADQCSFRHDACRDVERYPVGQNIAQTSSTGVDKRTPEDMIQMWYDEVDIFNNREVDNFQTVNGVGHYTQIVWAETTKIGCGRIKYQDGKWNRHYLVCNYGPAGNWYGERIYEARW